MGLNPGTPVSHSGLKADTQPLSHPGVPCIQMFEIGSLCEEPHMVINQRERKKKKGCQETYIFPEKNTFLIKPNET